MEKEARAWLKATLVRRERIASNMTALIFNVPEAEKHIAGQHYDIRLVSKDGYIAERSYSIVSSPQELPLLEFGVEVLEDGEVSPYLAKMELGSLVEIRGPIGGHFIYDKKLAGRLCLLAGGSGITPFISMIRQQSEEDRERKITLLLSVRNILRIPYLDELKNFKKENSNFEFSITITEENIETNEYLSGRIDETMITNVFFKNGLGNQNLVYICGPTSFVEVGANLFRKIGVPSQNIRTERFG